MIASLTADFVGNEILPRAHDLDEMQDGLMLELLRKTGELGLLAPDVPEEWGGMGLDLTSSLLITENMGAAASFAVSHSDHTVLGSLPIAFFGNEKQKKDYLGALCSGEKIAAYALTESASGSDALAAKTKAVMSDDGRHYILNGAKQFITNAGIADVFIVYAKVDGEKLTAFIVDKDTAGLSLGAEEKKTGISGSSTRSVNFEDAKVSVDNVLFEIGRGHVVALNVLNFGRLKLAAQCLGAAKAALGHAAKYAQERTQFGQAIAKFGLIQEKLARMASLIYVAESMIYRTAGRLNETLASIADDAARAATLSAYGAECAMNKVFATEMLDYVADQTVQIFGGYGYSKEYPAEKIARDARINRLFVGTSEINRLTLARSVLADLPQGELAATAPLHDLVSAEGLLLVALKKALHAAASAAEQRFGGNIEGEQEVLGLVADVSIGIAAMDSGYLRAATILAADGADKAAAHLEMLRSFCFEMAPKLRWQCAEILAAAASEAPPAPIAELDRLLDSTCVRTIATRRQVAARVLEVSAYPLS